MANTFSQVYVQYVFAVKKRRHLVPKKHKHLVHKYITGIIQNRKHKLISIHCMPDHIHILVGLHPAQSMSMLAKDIKTESTKFIKKQYWMPFAFSWQRGYGIFSYSRSQISRVAAYIENQEKRHQKTTFKKEYKEILDKLEIPYEDRYLFDFFD